MLTLLLVGLAVAGSTYTHLRVGNSSQTKGLSSFAFGFFSAVRDAARQTLQGVQTAERRDSSPSESDWNAARIHRSLWRSFHFFFSFHFACAHTTSFALPKQKIKHAHARTDTLHLPSPGCIGKGSSAFKLSNSVRVCASSSGASEQAAHLLRTVPPAVKRSCTERGNKGLHFGCPSTRAPETTFA